MIRLRPSRRRPAIPRRTLLAALLLGLPAACARYTPLPLPPLPTAAAPASLDHQGVDLSRPLGAGALARLALLNNPDLKAARTALAVAQAQRVQAGLYANPSLTAALLPLLAGPAAPNPRGQATPSYNAGLTYDLRSLLTHGARVQEAGATVAEIDAQLLWQEWQVMGAARLLAADLILGAQLLDTLDRQADLLGAVAASSHQALAAGDATLATALQDQSAAAAARTVRDAARRTQTANAQRLDALLGLAPGTPLRLAPTLDLPPVDPEAVRAALASLPQRRPDLIALQYGYAAQDARLRAAILAQFPGLSFGFESGSDNSNIRNIGPQIAVDLPLFDRNQGTIAIERATRAQLYAEYAARLTAAAAEVADGLHALAEVTQQRAALQATLPPLTEAANAADAAAARSDLDARSAATLRVAALARAQDIITLDLTCAEQSVSLATLIGAGLPQFHPAPPKAG